MSKRIRVTLLTGALLGIFCIVGAQLRTTEELAIWYLFAFWFNRLLMGYVIGLLPNNSDIWKLGLRGFIIGIIVSFAFYSATNFQDVTGFLVGGVYGIVIEFIAYKFVKN